MWNERLPQRMSLASTGMDTCVQFGWPDGQTTPGTVNAGLRLTVCGFVSNPAGWKVEFVMGAGRRFLGGGRPRRAKPAPRRCGRVVVNHRVVPEVDVHRILDRHA